VWGGRERERERELECSKEGLRGVAVRQEREIERERERARARERSFIESLCPSFLTLSPPSLSGAMTFHKPFSLSLSLSLYLSLSISLFPLSLSLSLSLNISSICPYLSHMFLLSLESKGTSRTENQPRRSQKSERFSLCLFMYNKVCVYVCVRDSFKE